MNEGRIYLNGVHPCRREGRDAAVVIELTARKEPLNMPSAGWQFVYASGVQGKSLEVDDV